MFASKHLAALVIVPALALGSYSGVRIVKNLAPVTGSLVASNQGTENSNSSSSRSSSSSIGINPFSVFSSSSRYSSSSASSKTSEDMYKDYLHWLENQGSSLSSVMGDLHNAASSVTSSEIRSSEGTSSSSSNSSVESSASSMSGETRSESSASTSETTSSPEAVKDELGCFTENSIWTTDRELCAEIEKQADLIREQAEKENRLDAVPPKQSEDDATLEVRISERFNDDAIRTRRRSELLNVIQEARTKIENLVNKEGISNGTKAYFIQSVQWFGDAQEYFSSDERSDLDISRMVTATQDTLTNVTTLLQNEHIVPTGNANIVSIVERTERLLKKFYQSFAEIAQTGEPLDQTAVASYAEAQSRFDSLKGPCVERNEGCEHIDTVLELLSKAKRFLEEGFAKYPDVRARVEAVFP